MFKLSSFIILIYSTYSFAQKCFTTTDIFNSDNLFSYKGKVYDITNYSHPGGQNTLKMTIGQPLEQFVNMNKYDFHLNSNKFTNDLKNMYIGILSNNCNIPDTTTIQPNTDTTTIQPNTDTTTIQSNTDTTTIQPTTDTTTIQPNTDTTTIQPNTDTTTIQPNTFNCIPFDFNPLDLLNVTFELNSSFSYKIDNGIKLILRQDLGAVRFKTNDLFHYGKIDTILKVSNGSNVISAFYIESDNKDQVVFNIIHNQGNDKNAVIESNFFYQGNLIYDINAEYYYPIELLSQTYNKYTLIWMPDFYEWRLNDILLRRLNKNETINFPDSPSRIKFSIWEGPPSNWAGPGIQWNQSQFEYQILSVKLSCPDTFISGNSTFYTNSFRNLTSNSNKNMVFGSFTFITFISSFLIMF